MSHYQTRAIRQHGGNDVIITISLHDDKMLYSDDTTIPTTDKGQGWPSRTVVHFSMVPQYLQVGQRAILRKAELREISKFSF